MTWPSGSCLVRLSLLAHFYRTIHKAVQSTDHYACGAGTRSLRSRTLSRIEKGRVPYHLVREWSGHQHSWEKGGFHILPKPMREGIGSISLKGGLSPPILAYVDLKLLFWWLVFSGIITLHNRRWGKFVDLLLSKVALHGVQELWKPLFSFTEGNFLWFSSYKLE